MAKKKRDPRRDKRDSGKRTKKKVSVLNRDSVDWVDYKDVPLLKTFISERGKIRARRVTGNDAQQQRAVATAIKTARELALLPYNVRIATGAKGRRRRDRDDEGGDRGDRGERGDRFPRDDRGDNGGSEGLSEAPPITDVTSGVRSPDAPPSAEAAESGLTEAGESPAPNDAIDAPEASAHDEED